MAMDYQLKILLLWGLGICIVFGIIIYLGLRNLKKMTVANQSLKLLDMKRLLPQGLLETSDSLIYGIYQNYSATKVGFIVRNSSDQDIGEINYKTGHRTGWLEITCMGESYEASTLNTWSSHTVVLHKVGDAKLQVCVFRRHFFRVTYDIPGIGVLESKTLGFLRDLYNLKRSYILGNRIIGFVFIPQNSQYSPRIVGLRVPIPLESQMFMLATG